MKILYIAHRINASDGSAIHCREFVQSIRQLGHEIQTFPSVKENARNPSAGSKKDSKNFFYYFKKINHKIIVYYLQKLIRRQSEFLSMTSGLIDSVLHYYALKKIRIKYIPDIIIYRNLMFQFAPFWLSKRFKIPILLELNALRSMEATLINKQNKITFITRWAERMAVQSADILFCVSEQVKYYLNNFRQESEISVIPNGVDTNKFDPEKYDKQLMKKKLGLQGKTVLGYAGSYKTWHGVDIAVRIIEMITKTTKTPYHLLLIGNGNGFDRIKAQIEKKNLTSDVTQVDSVAHEEIPQYIACFDYALMSYPDMKSFHGSPLKMFEYMAMGIPVVATDIGQIGEIITDNHTGFLAYPPTPENFVKAIIDGQDNLDKIAINSRKLMIDKYSWISNAKKVLEICNRLASAKKNF